MANETNEQGQSENGKLLEEMPFTTNPPTLRNQKQECEPEKT